MAFIASLARSRDPVAEIDGALAAERIDPRLSPEDRALLVAERLRLLRGRA